MDDRLVGSNSNGHHTRQKTWRALLEPRRWIVDPSRSRLTWALVALYLMATGILATAEFASERAQERARIQASMVSAGYALDQILGADFHDKYTPSHPIPAQDYARLVSELNRFAHHLGVEYVYSMVHSKGRVQFVVSNETHDDTLRGTPSRFYNPYPQPPVTLLQAFTDTSDQTHHYATYTNIWDSYYSVFIPRKSPQGTRYVLAADIKLSDYRIVLLRCLFRSALVVLVLLLPLVPLVVYQRALIRSRLEKAQQDQRHLDELTRLNQQLEDTVGRRTADLEQAMQDLKRFSYTVSHDLTTPLNAILGYAELLRADTGTRLAQEDLAHLDHIVSASARMAALIRSLLLQATTGNTPVEIVPIDLSAMAEEVATELRTAGQTHQAGITIAPGLRAHGDPSMLRLVVQNLLSNAFKYSRGTAHARVWMEGGRDHTFDWFEIGDNGAGFPPDLADRLFRPFGRLHGDEFEGFGIGLSHVARIVEGHGGTISGTGYPGEGAVFRVRLPRPAATRPDGVEAQELSA